MRRAAAGLNVRRHCGTPGPFGSHRQDLPCPSLRETGYQFPKSVVRDRVAPEVSPRAAYGWYLKLVSINRPFLIRESGQVERTDCAHPDSTVPVVDQVVPGNGMGKDNQATPVQGEPRQQLGQDMRSVSQLAAPVGVRADRPLMDPPHFQFESPGCFEA